MLPFILKSELDIRKDLGLRYEKIRLIKNLSRESLSEKSGVSLSTIKRFEKTGDISLKSLVSISTVLDKAYEIDNLIKIDDFKNVTEVRNSKRKRGRN